MILAYRFNYQRSRIYHRIISVCGNSKYGFSTSFGVWNIERGKADDHEHSVSGDLNARRSIIVG